MIIGVDFDNTIVRYDEVFRRLAVEKGLVPASLSASKKAVRDYLRNQGQEDIWTELQGYAYGPGMQLAQPFPGVLSFFARCRQLGIPVFIISHRTQYPYLGKQYDLHQAARDWLAAYGFHDPARIGLPADRVYLELTKLDKLARIAAVGCSHFIDDLPEFLAEPEFPGCVEKILFDPNALHPSCAAVRRADSWEAIAMLMFPEES